MGKCFREGESSFREGFGAWRGLEKLPEADGLSNSDQAPVQLNRLAEDVQPRLDHVKKSVGLEEAADVEVPLHRDRPEAPEGDTPNTRLQLPEMDVTVAKNREGATGVRTVSPSLRNSRILTV